MGITTRLRRIKIKLLNWEYWNIYVVYFPINLVWFFYALRAQKLFFFTGVNPGIYASGFFGASKSKILSQIPDNLKPKTTLIPRSLISQEEAMTIITTRHEFPCIVKPDIGERGLMVHKINTREELIHFYNSGNYDFIIQEFSTLDEEYSVLCFKDPQSITLGQNQYVISSLCRKEFLEVVGDGRSDLADLIKAKPRALLQMDRIIKEDKLDLKYIPALNENVLIEPIGNHSRGTKFLDYNHKITPDLTKIFGEILQSMDKIDYGRFDLKTSSLSDLKKGHNIHILEFNGTASEPSHCYDPKNSIFTFYHSMIYHWNKMYHIFQADKNNRDAAMSIKEYISAYNSYRRLTSSYDD